MDFTELFINNDAIETQTESSMELFKEMAIDFTTGQVITSNDEIVILEKNEALNVWIWKALETERNRYKAYSSSFGNDLFNEIGLVYDRTIKSQILFSEIYNCLIVNPYILNVFDFKEELVDDISVKITFKYTSVYGNSTGGTGNVNF